MTADNPHYQECTYCGCAFPNNPSYNHNHPEPRRPRLLALFCGAGGDTKGYQQAGFHVTGVDINPQPNYCGDEFHQADALTFPLDGYDAIHAGPPCQDHSTLSAQQAAHGTGWMLAATVERLRSLSVPWIVENVVGPTVVMDGWWFTLCGSSFALGVRRHRRFGSNQLMLAPPCRHDLQPRPIDVTGGGGPSYTIRTDGKGGRSNKADVAGARRAMGIDWMTRKELSQAIPPAYTEWIGGQLLEAVRVTDNRPYLEQR